MTTIFAWKVVDLSRSIEQNDDMYKKTVLWRSYPALRNHRWFNITPFCYIFDRPRLPDPLLAESSQRWNTYKVMQKTIIPPESLNCQQRIDREKFSAFLQWFVSSYKATTKVLGVVLRLIQSEETWNTTSLVSAERDVDHHWFNLKQVKNNRRVEFSSFDWI